MIAGNAAIVCERSPPPSCKITIRPGPRVRQHVRDDRLRARSPPVAGIDRPQHHEHPHPLQGEDRPVVVDAVRRPEQSRRGRAHPFDANRISVDLEVLAGGVQVREPGVVLRVVADLESMDELVSERAGEHRQLLADHEERRGHVHAHEDPHDRRRVRARSVVERQRHQPTAARSGRDERRVAQRSR